MLDVKEIHVCYVGMKEDVKKFLAFIRFHLAPDFAPCFLLLLYLIASNSFVALLISVMSALFCMSSMSLLSASHSFAYATCTSLFLLSMCA